MKNVFISGVSSDIGQALAKMFIQKGYYVIGTYNNNLNKANILTMDKTLKNKISIYHCDLKKEEDICHLTQELVRNEIKLDIIINNAALAKDNDIESKTKEEFMEVLEVNVVGTFLLIKNLIKLMKKGIIINIASTDAIDTYNEINFDYAASKAAVINLTKSLALIYKEVSLYSVAPNWVDTPGIRQLNSEYLQQELIKNKQGRLIKLDEVCASINDIINNNYQSGTNFIIDIDQEKNLVWRKDNG